MELRVRYITAKVKSRRRDALRMMRRYSCVRNGHNRRCVVLGAIRSEKMTGALMPPSSRG
jgi:hypothetical protein